MIEHFNNTQNASICCCVYPSRVGALENVEISPKNTPFKECSITRNASISCLVNYTIILCNYLHYIIIIYTQHTSIIAFIHDILALQHNILASCVRAGGVYP